MKLRGAAPQTVAPSPVAEPPATNPRFVPARELALHSTGVDSPRGWVMKEDGYVGAFVRVDHAGPVRVIARAFGPGDEKVLSKLTIVVADSSTSDFVAHAPEDYYLDTGLPRGTYFVRLELGRGVPAGPRELTIESLAVEGATLLPGGSDTLALAAADTYIENFRKRRGSVNLSDAPPGALAKVALVRPAFGFGTNIPGATNRMIPKKVAAGSEAEKFQSLVLGRFDTVVLSNGGKWVYQEERRDKVDLTYVDRFLDFAEEHRLRARMHTMLWDTVQEPVWVASVDPKSPGLLTRARSGDEKSKTELRAEISERIGDYVGARAKRYDELDVLNESAHKARYLEAFGERGLAEIIVETARAAARAGARTRLYLNEYNLLQWSVDPKTSAPDPYANWYRRHADALAREGAPIGFLGVQYYADGRDAAEIGPDAHSALRIFQVLQNLSVTGRRLVLTEFEVRGGTTSRDRAAVILDETMRLAFGTPSVDSFLIWAIWAAAASTPEPASILFEKDGSITEAGRRYDALRAAWTTRLEVPVGANGSIEFSGFLGEYTATIDGKTQKFSFPPRFVLDGSNND